MSQTEGKTELLKLKGDSVDIMCSANEEFPPHDIYEGKINVSYMKVQRVIYGCLGSSMLWYNLYVTTLKDMGFELNP